MADRTVYGLTHSENGWRMVDQGSCVWIKVPGAEHVSLQIREGQPAKILAAFAADFHAYVEPLRDADSACWTATNSVASSNHLSGTAMDLNWNGPDGKTFRFQIPEDRAYPPPKNKAVRELLDFYEGMVYCGGFWSIRDWMHFQMSGDTYGANNVDRVNDFIHRKIRGDGFSTFRRTNAIPTTPDAAVLLSQAMGGTVSLDRYRALLPALSAALDQCQCNTIERRAMWFAQIGHESAGLKYMEEIADGSAYEGRRDLGNTQPGDGRRFKGRGPIQITGRHNYTALSRWAHEKGYVPSAMFFVDNPFELASDRYGFLGVVWYWTVARRMNSYADAQDLEGATRAINGGLNGLADRRTRYDRCKAMGAQLLAINTGDDDPLANPEIEKMVREIHAALFNPIGSESKYKTEGEGKIYTTKDLPRFIDKNLHEILVERQAMAGNPEALALVKREADKGDKWAAVMYNYATGG